ncbi:hypothetical protein [Burkholderia cenocepacia]|uniref:hypothetical protein n=1 Tax=Burkholderia cenocepacia TaxID=95486 RepID=UPI0013E0BB0B|nr:hypothetical protein [Burkholderia cenocepacia]MCW3587422.1 hypothetical protein [Burkholderia cenocepacia]MCW3633882.1 hypothetical protein [Burkholderia cenocepacia]MCW5184784.1 hypothetical protein [Burkholderia cenocepacia]NGO98014.1 hypothetical protein [Burkholderia cenocepacia]
MTPEIERQSSTKRESALHGLLRNYGASLRFADKVIACFQTDTVSAEGVQGILFSFDARVPLVFERRWVIGDVDLLPRPGERAMLRVTARPWVDGLGHITLRAKHFMILPPRTFPADEQIELATDAGDLSEKTNA